MYAIGQTKNLVFFCLLFKIPSTGCPNSQIKISDLINYWNSVVSTTFVSKTNMRLRSGSHFEIDIFLSPCSNTFQKEDQEISLLWLEFK